MSPITRREFLATAAVVPLVLFPDKNPTSAAARQPNIVFIIADDLGYADLGTLAVSLAEQAAVESEDPLAISVASATRAWMLTGNGAFGCFSMGMVLLRSTRGVRRSRTSVGSGGEETGARNTTELRRSKSSYQKCLTIAR